MRAWVGRNIYEGGSRPWLWIEWIVFTNSQLGTAGWKKKTHTHTNRNIPQTCTQRHNKKNVPPTIASNTDGTNTGYFFITTKSTHIESWFSLNTRGIHVEENTINVKLATCVYYEICTWSMEHTIFCTEVYCRDCHQNLTNCISFLVFLFSLVLLSSELKMKWTNTKQPNFIRRRWFFYTEYISWKKCLLGYAINQLSMIRIFNIVLHVDKFAHQYCMTQSMPTTFYLLYRTEIVCSQTYLTMNMNNKLLMGKLHTTSVNRCFILLLLAGCECSRSRKFIELVRVVHSKCKCNCQQKHIQHKRIYTFNQVYFDVYRLPMNLFIIRFNVLFLSLSLRRIVACLFVILFLFSSYNSK